MREKKKIPFAQALLWIVGSMLVISGGAYSGAHAYLRHKKNKTKSPAHQISSIIQTGPQKEALNSVYFAELLGLSADRPKSSLTFDVKVAEKKLLESPVIKEAKVKLASDTTLYIDYTCPKPIAWVFDYENIAIDEEGYLFPVTPFFSPKNLPEIYIGLKPFGAISLDPNRPTAKWNEPLKSPLIDLALSLLKMLQEMGAGDLFTVRRIDVSNADAQSYGQREIVLLLEDEVIAAQEGKEVHFICPRLLRLSPKNYAQELGNFLKLREKLLDEETEKLAFPKEGETVRLKEKILDFRIPSLAYIEK